MRLKARLDGRCEVCERELIDLAFSVIVTSHSMVMQSGEPAIKEEHEVTRVICPACYRGVYHAIETK